MDHCPPQPVQAGGETERAPRLGICWKPRRWTNEIQIHQHGKRNTTNCSEVVTAIGQSADSLVNVRRAWKTTAPRSLCKRGARSNEPRAWEFFGAPREWKKKFELINAKSGIQQIGSEVWTASEQSADERKFCQKILKSMADHCHRSLWGGGT